MADARIGQKDTLTRRLTRRGPRPRAVHDQRTKWTYIFGIYGAIVLGAMARSSAPSPSDRWRIDGSILGAICPERGVGAGLVMPDADMPAMQAPLAEISAAVAPGVHAGLVLDPAGWHMSATLKVPDTVTPDTIPPDTVPLVPLPPRSPELNPVETIWQVMRDTWLSNRISAS